mgnify:FL=1
MMRNKLNKNDKIIAVINKMREKNHRVLKGLYTKKRMGSIEDSIIDFYIGRNSQLDDIEDYLGIEKDET